MGADAEAFELAVAALARKERTVAEVRELLAERGCEPDEVATAVDRLVEIGQLDDAGFARRFAEDKRELRGWGPDRIAAALEARGIAPDAIDAALVEDGGEQVERAMAVLAERGASASDDAARARAFALLVRRGYPSEVAYEAVRRLERDACEASGRGLR